MLVGLLRALMSAGAVVALGRLVDDLSAGRSSGAAITWLVLFLAVRTLLAPAVPLLAAATATTVERDLRRRALDAMVRIGPTDADRRTGAVVTQATEGVNAVGDYAGRFLPQLIGGIATPLLLALVVATIDVPTAVVLVLVLPIMPGLLRGLEGRFASVTTRYRETADTLAAQFLDGVQGLRALKSMDRAQAYGDAIAEESERLRVETMRLLRVNQLALFAVDSLFTIGTVVAASGMAAWRLTNNAITIGEAVTLVLLGVMLIEPLSQIGRFFYVGAIGRAAATQLRKLFATAPDPDPAPPVAADSRGIGSIGLVTLSSVRFAYGDGPDILRGVTLRVEPGERVALVGPSGSGKTTIASMIAGLHRPRSGSVQVNGRVALVPQRPYLFDGTVADNLRLASPGASDDELWSALQDAELADLVRSRQGLDTDLGERGLKLSGGEAQRLAIARALLVDAPVVVLDEPTSNVDLDTEARIKTAIARLTVGRTVLVIAHRLSTITGSDRFLRLDQGRIIDTGSGADAAALINQPAAATDTTEDLDPTATRWPPIEPATVPETPSDAPAEPGVAEGTGRSEERHRPEQLHFSPDASTDGDPNGEDTDDAGVAEETP